MRYLVVANQTLAGQHLAEVVRERTESDPTASFHLVIPATRPQHHLVWTEGEAHVIAQERLEAAITAFEALGATVTGEVGDERAIEAVGDALRRDDFDEIIISTLPAGVSRWLKVDLPHRLERAFHRPVTHVIATPERA
jgi:GABA permease